MAAGECVAAPQFVDGALEADGPTRGAGSGTQIHHVIGDHDRLWFMFHHQHGVALVPQ